MEELSKKAEVATMMKGTAMLNILFIILKYLSIGQILLGRMSIITNKEYKLYIRSNI